MTQPFQKPVRHMKYICRHKRRFNTNLLVRSLALYLASLIFIPEIILASGYSIMGGYFQLDAKTKTTRDKLANLGIYHFVYESEIGDRFVFRPSYSFYILGTKSMDLGFGFDLELAYYPFTFNRPFQYNDRTISWSYFEVFRPSIGFSFNQRQYQSINSSYAGAGITLSIDYQFSEKYYITTKIRYISLKGPLTSHISEYNVMGGIGASL
ncbi:MAG: hypothetical protein HQK54_08225 [Oligoflexales bacterium]|nr:hypothetical protein [Oligoflexales bacterium]